MRLLLDILIRIVHYRAFGIFALTAGLLVLFYFISPEGRFFDPRSLRIILTRAPEYGIVALGMTYILISRELDLSVGSVFTFSALVFAILFLQFGLHPFLALIITLGVGTLIGGMNGLISLKFRIPSIITTLGMMFVWRGLALIMTQGVPLYYDNNLPFGGFLTMKIGGFLPMGFIWFLVITIILSLILNFHKFGNRMCATGGNTLSAKEIGINTDGIKLACFGLLGMLIAFAAIVESTRIGEGSARLGYEYEFYAIAAAVIGGTSIFGGVGTIVGTFFGAIILEVIRTGLAVIGIPGWWFKVFVGGVIVGVVVLNTFIGEQVRHQGTS